MVVAFVEVVTLVAVVKVVGEVAADVAAVPVEGVVTLFEVREGALGAWGFGAGEASMRLAYRRKKGSSTIEAIESRTL